MRSASPWSVKGIDPEAREAAKMAARRAGVPLGVWLSNVIRKSATEQLKSGGSASPFQPPPPPQYQPPSYGEAPDPRAAYASNGTPPGGHRPPAPTTEAVLESINRLAAKIEAAETRTAEAIVPLAEKVKALSQKVEEVQESKSLDSAPLERALARMAERLDHIEDGPRVAAPSGGREKRDPRKQQGFFSRLFSD